MTTEVATHVQVGDMKIPLSGAGGGGIAVIPPPSFGAPRPPPDMRAESLTLQVGRIDWPYILGAYTGSWAAGATIGYLAQGSPRGAITGGMAASAVWGAAETIHQWKAFHYAMAVGFLTVSAGSFYWALRRKP